MPEPLTAKAVSRLIAAGNAAEVRDGRTRGLVLRVAGVDRYSWSFRRAWKGRDYRLDLGSQWTLEQARDLVAEIEVRCALDRAKKAELDRPWFAFADEWRHFVGPRLRKANGIVEPEVVARKPNPPPKPDTHTWEVAIETWSRLELSRVYRESTAYGYRMALNVAEMHRFRNRDVDGITRVEAAEAIAAIHRRGAERQANTTSVAMRSLFAFLGEDDQTRLSNVEPGRMAALKAPRDTLDEDDERDDSNSLLVPDGPMVGHLVRALLAKGAVPSRDRLAGRLLAYTVQRRRAVALARKDDFESAEAGIWKMRPLHRKTASTKRRRGVSVGDHVVVLPPRAWAVVQAAMTLDPDSAYLFPPLRERRKGQESLHLHPSVLTHMFAAVPGNPVKPHDMRRAFATTYANEAGLDDLQVKWVLDHSEGIKSGDTTRAHYRLVSGQDPKWPVMAGWCDWVDKWAATKD